MTQQERAREFSIFSRNNRGSVNIPQNKGFIVDHIDFDVRRRTVFIVHGFMSNGRSGWPIRMKNSFLNWVSHTTFYIVSFGLLREKKFVWKVDFSKGGSILIDNELKFIFDHILVLRMMLQAILVVIFAKLYFLWEASMNN